MLLILAMAAAGMSALSAYNKMEREHPFVTADVVRSISRTSKLMLALANGVLAILSALTGSGISVSPPTRATFGAPAAATADA